MQQNDNIRESARVTEDACVEKQGVHDVIPVVGIMGCSLRQTNPKR
jgi:hypothetical protein